MRLLPVALAVLSLAASAQPGLDVSVAAGGVAHGASATLAPDVAPMAAAAVVVAPGLPRGIRGVATVTVGPGVGRSDYGRLAALGVGVEVPLSGGRNGVYLALGGALVDFDNYDPAGCLAEPDCLFEAISVAPHRGLAGTAGVGARVPVGRLWIEPTLSAMVWDDVLLGARLGVGWRLR